MRFPQCCACLLLLCLVPCSLAAKGPKTHTVVAGKPNYVFWTDSKSGDKLAMTIRPLLVDGRRKAWLSGETHDVTDHSFTALEVQHLNDALPGEKPHFVWQATGWIEVEKSTGHVTELHFAGYDPEMSGLSWFRDMAAFCAVPSGAKSVSAVVMELGSRKAVARKKLSAWPRDLPTAEPATVSAKGPKGVAVTYRAGGPQPRICTNIQWDRDPVRVTFTLLPGEQAVTLNIGAEVPEAEAKPED